MAKKSGFLAPWLTRSVVRSFSKGDSLSGRLLFNSKDTLVLPKDAPDWVKEKLLKNPAAVSMYESAEGPVWIVSPFLKADKKAHLKSDPLLEPSPFAKIRDAAGLAFQQAQKSEIVNLSITLPVKADEARAFLIGLEIAQYKFKLSLDEKPEKWQLQLSNIDAKIVKEAERAGHAVNIARHLVNMPPNELTPTKFASFAKKLLGGAKGVRIEVWNKERLKKEKMNLLLAVGGAAANEPCLVHLRYRSAKKTIPIALVGKGITFDSGGLDLKTAAGMRLMKKDMGGAAAVLATFFWSAMSRAEQSLDAYLSLAENAVGSHAFRPGDIYTSRSGQTVEITNTDAEGRLVLADALDVAVTQKEKPAQIVNVATLTGAIKVGLGANLAGLFSNHHPLAEKIQSAFARAGDPAWYMPLYQKYRASMGSTVADMTNSVEAPFGGAITAALFLESFVNETPWAHLDIYGWKDAADGAWSEGGGSGQAVLGLIQWLSSGLAKR